MKHASSSNDDRAEHQPHDLRRPDTPSSPRSTSDWSSRPCGPGTAKAAADTGLGAWKAPRAMPVRRQLVLQQSRRHLNQVDRRQTHPAQLFREEGHRRHRREIREVRPAVAVRGAEPRNRTAGPGQAADHLVPRALEPVGAHGIPYAADPGFRQEVVYVPVQSPLRPQVVPQPAGEPSQGAACINVPARHQVVNAQPAYSEPQPGLQWYQQCIRARVPHALILRLCTTTRTPFCARGKTRRSLALPAGLPREPALLDPPGLLLKLPDAPEGREAQHAQDGRGEGVPGKERRDDAGDPGHQEDRPDPGTEVSLS